MAKVLILGGTAEAVELAARLASIPRLDTVTSLAGLTSLPTATGGRMRRGGFGGPDGLAAYLRDEGTDIVVDATHPFASRIAEHAAEAAATVGLPRVKLVRPAFERSGLDLSEASDFAEAARLVPAGARVFLAAGRREIAAFAERSDIWCLVRMIEPPTAAERLPKGEVILGRPPEDWRKEAALFESHSITHVVSKDSGGRAGAKIEAARRRALPVILVKRPDPPAGETVASVDEAVAFVARHLDQRG